MRKKKILTSSPSNHGTQSEDSAAWANYGCHGKKMEQLMEDKMKGNLNLIRRYRRAALSGAICAVSLVCLVIVIKISHLTAFPLSLSCHVIAFNTLRRLMHTGLKKKKTDCTDSTARYRGKGDVIGSPPQLHPPLCSLHTARDSLSD